MVLGAIPPLLTRHEAANLYSGSLLQCDKVCEWSRVPEVDVRLDRVTKRFGDVTAVDDLSLAIERGEFFGRPAAARRPRCA